jgi:hypothetical protein
MRAFGALFILLGGSFGVALTAGAQQAPGQTTTRPDLLSWAAGAFAVRLEAPATNETIRRAIDGSLRTQGIGIPRRDPLPHRFVIELPAPTVFDTFAVPVINQFGPARGRHVKTIVVEGSSASADDGFSPLATLVLELDRTEPQRFAVPGAPRPVRWLRVQFVDRLIPPPSDVDEVVFSELIGYGTQEPIVVPADRFTGRWRYRRTGINDVPGTNLVSLVQEANIAYALEREDLRDTARDIIKRYGAKS